MQQYETLIVLTPLLSEEATKEAIAKFRGILTDNGAEIINEDNWGLKKLAYPIQKKSTGFYFLVEFEAEGSVVAEYELQMKRDERVIRFLTVKMDKDHVTYSERRRAKLAKA